MELEISTYAGVPGQIETVAEVAGDVLTVDGVAYDLSGIPEGGTAEPEGSDHPFIGTITREGGVIRAKILWRYGSDADRDQPTDLAPWVLTVTDGPVLPPIVRVEEAAE